MKMKYRTFDFEIEIIEKGAHPGIRPGEPTDEPIWGLVPLSPPPSRLGPI